MKKLIASLVLGLSVLGFSGGVLAQDAAASAPEATTSVAATVSGTGCQASITFADQGAARIALATGCPVIPVGQWGAHEILPPYSARLRLGRTATCKVGDPVDLSRWAGKPITTDVLHEATDAIMDAITSLVADIRGEEPPAERFDPRAAGVNEIGNPNKPRRELG